MKYLLLVFVVVMVGCQTTKKQTDIAGFYESPDYSQLQLGWAQYIEGVMYGGWASLNLMEDSTFKYQTCGNIINGRWFVQNDSLMLEVNSNRWRSDSFHQHTYNGRQPKVPDKPVPFVIRGNKLIQEIENSTEYQGKTYDSVEELIKVEASTNQ